MDAVPLILLIVAVSSASASCPFGFESRPNSTECYRIFEMLVSWTQAYVFCESLSSHLLAIETPEEQKVIETMLTGLQIAHIKQAPLYWVDGHDLMERTRYMWMTTKKVITYTNWNTGEPNNFGGVEHCMAIYSTKFTWNDWNCKFSLGFICETPQTGTVIIGR